MLNGIVGYQLLDDGTPLSISLIVFSALLLFIGTGYIALDTGYSWTGYWDSTLNGPDNTSNALYTLYFLAPLVFICIFFLLEGYLVLRILGERKPMRKFSSVPLRKLR
jgi:H+/Cl- antiporter ClcA